MGQETSLPEDGEDEFGDAAQAPPSSFNPSSASTAVRPGSKMINAMLHRAAPGHDLEGKEGLRGTIGAEKMAYKGHNSTASFNPNMHYQMQQQPQQHYNSSLVTPEKHQHMHQQQVAYGMEPQLNQQQHVQHQQGIAQHMMRGQVYPTPDSVQPHAQEKVLIGSAKKSQSSRPGGRGAALINSMRNLSLAGTLRVATPSSTKKKGGTHDWETRWDEDDDDSEGDTDDALALASPTGQGSVPMHQPLQLGIDGTHAATTSVYSSPNELIRSQQVHSVTPSTYPEGMVNNSQMTMVPNQMTEEHANYEKPNQGAYAASQDDALEWDTGARTKPDDVTMKPNFQMFLPLLRVLGKGSFGKVVLVQKRKGKEKGSLFAMKILRKSHLVKRRQIERTRTERKVLSAVNHPFIMKLHYAFQTPEKLYLVLDYCPGGELFFHLSRFRRFPERVARFYAAELLLAIGHLHKRGIIYRDLKPENVLLDADGHVKLGDFGLAKAGVKHPCEGATSMCGTPEYMAPEVLSQQGHGFCVDYWGLGMLLYEMMTGLPPWYTTDRSKLFRRLKNAPLDIPSYFSMQAANCVSALLDRNPRRRLGVSGVRGAMEHEFFATINWRALYSRLVDAPIRPCEGWKAPEVVTPTGTGISQQFHSSGIEQLDSHDLDAATANFDNTFTRMPVHTEDGANSESDGEMEELHEDTFLGFSFDDKDREPVVSHRQRATHFHPSGQQID